MDGTPVFKSNDAIFLRDGTLLKTHHESACHGKICCIHNPSDHILRDAPLNWRADRYLMERVCLHGVGHPDPDDLAYKRQHMPESAYRSFAFGIHGCDGCCHWPRTDEDASQRTLPGEY